LEKLLFELLLLSARKTKKPGSYQLATLPLPVTHLPLATVAATASVSASSFMHLSGYTSGAFCVAFNNKKNCKKKVKKKIRGRENNALAVWQELSCKLQAA